MIFESNYFWLMNKPPAGSLLDLMGPWPWYIFVGEFVALIHFYAAYFLYYTLNKPFKAI